MAPPPNSLFRPPAFLVGGHRQTILGFWSRRYLGWPLPTEDMVVAAGDDARLLVRATWQPGPRPHSPACLR